MVSLRAPTAADEEEFLAAVERSRELHGGWLEAPATPEDYRGYCDRVASEEAAGFLIVDDDGGDLAGYATIGNIVRMRLQSAYLGFAAFEPLAGRGLMKRGLRLVLDEAFGPMALHRVEANVQPANERSTALMKGLGFRLEGHSPRFLRIDGDWRDHDRWAITQEEWTGELGDGG